MDEKVRLDENSWGKWSLGLIRWPQVRAVMTNTCSEYIKQIYVLYQGFSFIICYAKTLYKAVILYRYNFISKSVHDKRIIVQDVCKPLM